MDERINSSGPWITGKEIDYVTDAVTNGWYSKFNDYTEQFEKKFAEYIGVKYAIATTNGTAALHLATSMLNLKKGDEVILPEISWAASADVIAYTGATPVFVDVDLDMWTINPESIRKAITGRTKAIMPVWVYGFVPNMEEVMKIAAKYGLAVIEDAAPAVASKFNGKNAGTFGSIGCFSFQGSKIMVTGEGGMFVTNNPDYYERAKILAEHGRDDKEKVFWCSEIGYQYSMGNLLASLGLAQLERIDELLEKKRQIWSWYRKYLPSNGVTLLTEPEGRFCNYSYPAILLDPQVTSVSRNKLYETLRANKIFTRPSFPRMSLFPQYSSTPRYDNKNAQFVEDYGMNLPAPFNLKESQAEYICGLIRNILGLS